MAVTDQFSNIRTAERDSASTVTSDMQSSREETKVFTFTQAGVGDANSTIELFTTPPGRSQIIASKCSTRNSAYGAARVMSFGWRAFVDAQGVTQAANLTGLGSAIDVAAASRKVLADAPTGAINSLVFETQRVLVAQVTGGTIPDLATLTGEWTFLLG